MAGISIPLFRVSVEVFTSTTLDAGAAEREFLSFVALRVPPSPIHAVLPVGGGGGGLWWRGWAAFRGRPAGRVRRPPGRSQCQRVWRGGRRRRGRRPAS